MQKLNDFSSYRCIMLLQQHFKECVQYTLTDVLSQGIKMWMVVFVKAFDPETLNKCICIVCVEMIWATVTYIKMGGLQKHVLQYDIWRIHVAYWLTTGWLTKCTLLFWTKSTSVYFDCLTSLKVLCGIFQNPCHPCYSWHWWPLSVR